MTQPSVTWRSDGQEVWIGCQVEVVQKSNVFGDTVRKPLLMGKSAYHSMLNDVKRKVERGVR